MHVIKYKARKRVPESVPPALGCAFQSLRLHSENTKQFPDGDCSQEPQIQPGFPKSAISHGDERLIAG